MMLLSCALNWRCDVLEDAVVNDSNVQPAQTLSALKRNEAVHLDGLTSSTTTTTTRTPLINQITSNASLQSLSTHH